MKITQGFSPVTIVLETEKEAYELFELLCDAMSYKRRHNWLGDSLSCELQDRLRDILHRTK